MKKVIVLAVMVMFGGAMMAQHCGNCPHHKQPHISLDYDKALLNKVFPTMRSTKADGRWNMVYDAESQLLGYVVYSKPASDGIKGYAGETPVMIVFDTKKVITGVYLLQNQETPRFVEKVEQAEFFSQWNGLTVKKARKKKVDTVSGATFTSRAVVESVQAALKEL